MKSMNLLSDGKGLYEKSFTYSTNPVLMGQYWYLFNNPLNLKAKDEDDETGDQEEIEDVSIDDEMNNDLDLEFDNDTDDFEDDEFEEGNYDDYA